MMPNERSASALDDRPPQAGMSPATAVKAQVVASLDPRFGGPSISVPALTRAMRALDQSVQLYFGGAPWPDEPTWPAYMHRSADDWPRALRRSSGLRQALNGGDLELVHHHGLWLPTLGYAWRAAQRQRRPLLISPRGMLSSYALARSRWRKKLASIVVHPGALRGAAGWHATSAIEADEIRRAGYRQPIVVAPNGVEIPTWTEPDDRRAWLDRHPELVGKRVLLFFSRLHSKKGVDWLIDAWSSLAASFSDWHLLIAGSADEFGFDELRTRAADHGISQRVTIADASGMPKPYRLAGLYVLPTRSENFGMTAAEALASGIPVLISDQAPWSTLDELGCGSCVPLDRFSDRLVELLRLSPETLQRMGTAGREHVTTTFSWQRQARLLLEFYATLA